MLDIGLVGLGPDWETCYKPALIRLRPRLRVRSVHTTVATRAEPVAAEFDCRPAPSLTALIERADLRAIVVLDPGWCGAVPVDLALNLGKPVFFANSGALPRDLIPRLAQRSAGTGVMLMPDLRIRYLPSTIRLRELIATRIGRPLNVEARWGAAADGESFRGKLNVRLVEVFDWFRAIAGTPPLRSTPWCDPSGVADGGSGCEIEFTRPAKGGEPLRCRLTTVGSRTSETCGPATLRPIELFIRCERGSAKIVHPTEIEWSGTDPGEPLHHESLTGERGDLELMLDHFARRVAGGLVPVPTFEDLEHAWSLRDHL